MPVRSACRWHWSACASWPHGSSMRSPIPSLAGGWTRPRGNALSAGCCQAGPALPGHGAAALTARRLVECGTHGVHDVCALVVSLSNSAAGLAHQAWLVSWTPRPESQARLVTSREGFTLVGVMVAAVLASQDGLTGSWAGCCSRPFWAGWPFADCLASPVAVGSASAGLGVARLSVARCPSRGLLGVMGLNALANAIPGTLFLFFVADQLGLAPTDRWRAAHGYFLAQPSRWCSGNGSCDNSRLAGFGRPRCWSRLRLVWATHSVRETLPFAIICLVTGFALGAELTCSRPAAGGSHSRGLASAVSTRHSSWDCGHSCRSWPSPWPQAWSCPARWPGLHARHGPQPGPTPRIRCTALRAQARSPSDVSTTGDQTMMLKRIALLAAAAAMIGLQAVLGPP